MGQDELLVTIDKAGTAGTAGTAGLTRLGLLD